MFQSFAEYMHSLLITPFRKVRKAANQFYLFFRITGRLFDDSRQDLFRVRWEAVVVSAGARMLEEHGRDRSMPRLKGEGLEGYRTRLCMKAVIAEKAGTVQGILLAMTALGYPEAHMERMALHDPERWAEFIVYPGTGTEDAVRDLLVIQGEIMGVKQASSMLAYLVITDHEELVSSLYFGVEVTSYTEIIMDDVPVLVEAKPTGTAATLRLQLDNRNAPREFHLQQIGIFARLLDGDREYMPETLLQVIEYDKPDIVRAIPHVSEYLVSTLTGDAEKVEGNIDMAAYVSIRQFLQFQNSLSRMDYAPVIAVDCVFPTYRKKVMAPCLVEEPDGATAPVLVEQGGSVYPVMAETEMEVQ